MIDKETRGEIVRLLIKRRKKLGHKTVMPLDLHSDLNWIMSHIGTILADVIIENNKED
ncbi:MAG: hypothetical protein ACE5WD_11675 [Candidatus Aminicenantia bacterium]